MSDSLEEWKTKEAAREARRREELEEQIALMKRDIEVREDTLAQQDRNIKNNVRINALSFALTAFEDEPEPEYDSVIELANLFVDFIEKD